MDNQIDAKSVIMLNYRDIVRHLTFKDMMRLIEALDLFEVPCSYDKISLKSAMHLMFLDDNQRHFNYLRLSMNKTCMYDACLPLCNGVSSIKMFACSMYNGMPVIKSVANMHSLVINKCNIQFITNLDSLIHLKVLNLCENKIMRIENLSTLTKLTLLDLSKNVIARMEGLNGLTSLTTLDLSNNLIPRIINLDSLTNLKHLNMCFNEIVRVENLDALVNLTYLNLNYTRVEKHPDLSHLKNLKDFFFSCKSCSPYYHTNN